MKPALPVKDRPMSETTGIEQTPAETPTETAAPPEPTRVAERPRWFTRKRVVLLSTGLLLTVTALTWGGLGKYIWGEEPVEKPPIVHVAPEGDEPETQEEREARWREQAIGRWHTFYRGNRYMTVRPDGTGTVVANLEEYNFVELAAVGASKVVFEIEWAIADGALKFDTVGGHPKGSVDFITWKYGAKKKYPIVHLNDEEFRYQSDTTDPDYVWTRIPDDAELPDKAMP